jgi:hypothetical protein
LRGMRGVFCFLLAFFATFSSFVICRQDIHQNLSSHDYDPFYGYRPQLLCSGGDNTPTSFYDSFL